MIINEFTIEITNGHKVSFLFPYPCHIWKAEYSFTGFGILCYQSSLSIGIGHLKVMSNGIDLFSGIRELSTVNIRGVSDVGFPIFADAAFAF